MRKAAPIGQAQVKKGLDGSMGTAPKNESFSLLVFSTE